MDCATGSAPGRLDFLGGVADYSGALVLEMPTRQSIDVVAEADDALVVGPAVLSVAETARLAAARVCRGTASPRGPAPVDALSHRCRHRPGPARDHLAAPRPPAHLVGSPSINGRGVERGVGGGHGACARGGGHRPADVGPAVPGGGELRGGRALRRHGPSGGRGRNPRCRAADSLPARLALARA